VKTIYVWGGWSRNFGDLAMYSAQTRLLQQQSTEPLRFIPINSDVDEATGVVPYISQTMVNTINTGDMLLIGAGGQLMPRKVDGVKNFSGHQINIPKRLIKKIKVPIVIYGVGLNIYWHGVDGSIDCSAIDHFRELCDAAALVSVRDGLSARLLNYMAVDVVDQIPDPAFFCEHENGASCLDTAEVDYPIIGINWAGDRQRLRLGSLDSRNTLLQTAWQLQRVLREVGGGDIVHIPHVSRYDMESLWQLREVLEDRVISISEVAPSLYPEQLWGVPELVRCYAIMGVVVATRWHAHVIPYGQGVPIVSLGDTYKNDAFTQDHPEVPQCLYDADGLSSAILTALKTRSAFRQMAKLKLANMRQVIDAFNRKVVDILNG